MCWVGLGGGTHAPLCLLTLLYVAPPYVNLSERVNMIPV